MVSPGAGHPPSDATAFNDYYSYQRRSRGHRARGQSQSQGHTKIRSQGQGQPFRGQVLSRPRTEMLEAKDQNTKRKRSPKKKKRFSKFFFRRSPKKDVFKIFFQAIYKILTIQKRVLLSSLGQSNFQGLEASRPRPSQRNSKCVLEARTSSRTPTLIRTTYIPSTLFFKKLKTNIH